MEKETRRREPRPKMYETEIINIGRVTKVTKVVVISVSLLQLPLEIEKVK